MEKEEEEGFLARVPGLLYRLSISTAEGRTGDSLGERQADCGGDVQKEGQIDRQMDRRRADKLKLEGGDGWTEANEMSTSVEWIEGRK